MKGMALPPWRALNRKAKRECENQVRAQELRQRPGSWCCTFLILKSLLWEGRTRFWKENELPGGRRADGQEWPGVLGPASERP